jgi:hypothetical protein
MSPLAAALHPPPFMSGPNFTVPIGRPHLCCPPECIVGYAVMDTFALISCLTACSREVASLRTRRPAEIQGRQYAVSREFEAAQRSPASPLHLGPSSESPMIRPKPAEGIDGGHQIEGDWLVIVGLLSRGSR